MMESFGVVVVAPLWGVISTQLFFKAVIELGKFFIFVSGLLRGKVKAHHNLHRLGRSIMAFVLYAGGLIVGIWVVTYKLHFDWTRIELYIYLAFALIGVLVMAPRLPVKFRKAWYEATVPGAAEEDDIAAKERGDSIL